MNKKRPSVTVGLLLFSAAPAVLAHHSSAMFDRSQTLVLAGSIIEYQFTNPHTWIEVLVENNDGTTTQWSIEASGRRPMVAMGLPPSRLQPGDEVVVRAHPLRDGRNGALFIDIELPDGEVIGGE